MPNTLAHFAIQGTATQLSLRYADARWVLVGCLIPDIPWILRRAIQGSTLPIDPYSLRLYAIVQSSLLFCLIVSALFAALSVRRRLTFWVLALGSLIHLLLDALQTRWGNGVHLLAPFSWKLQSLDFFWPESWVTIVMTLAGVAYYLWAFRHFAREPLPVSHPYRKQLLVVLGLAAVYLAGPLILLEAPLRHDNHSIQTLREREMRPGRSLELDRVRYLDTEGTDAVRTFAGERLAVSGIDLARSGTVSVRGRFVDGNTVWVSEMHRHWGRIRDIPSYLGLALVGVLWLAAPLHRSLTRRRPDPP
jgi:hypothetical protein